MTAGFFLVVEGPEGAGKSTLVEALATELRVQGCDPVLVREPGGTPVAEAIRRELLDPARHLEPMCELLYFATARADRVSRVIRPALAAGKIVLSDRYELSTAAYQIGGRGLDPEMVRLVNDAATGGLQPDLTLILDIPPELGQRRQSAAGKSPDRLESESPEFHRRVAEYYSAAIGPAVFHLSGSLNPERVLHSALEVLAARWPGRFRATSVG